MPSYGSRYLDLIDIIKDPISLPATDLGERWATGANRSPTLLSHIRFGQGPESCPQK